MIQVIERSTLKMPTFPRCIQMVFWMWLSGTQAGQIEAIKTVIPGKGVINELEIGMSIDQVKQKTPDFLIETNASGYLGTLAALGVSVHAKTVDSPITLITFDVSAAITSNLFGGNLGQISFKPGRAVNRRDVIQEFGTLPKYHESESEQVRSLLSNWKDLAWSVRDSETLYYQSKGVMFNLKNEQVLSFSIVPTKAVAQKLRSREK